MNQIQTVLLTKTLFGMNGKSLPRNREMSSSTAQHFQGYNILSMRKIVSSGPEIRFICYQNTKKMVMIRNIACGTRFISTVQKMVYQNASCSAAEQTTAMKYIVVTIVDPRSFSMRMRMRVRRDPLPLWEVHPLNSKRRKVPRRAEKNIFRLLSKSSMVVIRVL